MTEQAAESTLGTNSAALRLLASWRGKLTRLYLLARIGQSVTVHDRVTVLEVVRDNAGEFVVYLSDSGFDPEHESAPYRPGASRFAKLWKLSLRNFEVAISGTTLTLRSDTLQVEISKQRPKPASDGYYTDMRLAECWDLRRGVKFPKPPP